MDTTTYLKSSFRRLHSVCVISTPLPMIIYYYCGNVPFSMLAAVMCCILLIVLEYAGLLRNMRQNAPISMRELYATPLVGRSLRHLYHSESAATPDNRDIFERILDEIKKVPALLQELLQLFKQKVDAERTTLASPAPVAASPANTETAAPKNSTTFDKLKALQNREKWALDKTAKIGATYTDKMKKENEQGFYSIEQIAAVIDAGREAVNDRLNGGWRNKHKKDYADLVRNYTRGNHDPQYVFRISNAVIAALSPVVGRPKRSRS